MEYLHHFKLSHDPFRNDSDSRFHYASAAFTDAERRTERALRQGRGLCVLTGEPGVGKSVLAHQIWELLEEEVFESSYIMIMPGSRDAFSVMRSFAAQIGVESPAEERAGLLGQLYDQLSIVREDGRHAVLILDDAHTLQPEVLAELGGLLALVYEERRLLSLLLVGGPRLDDVLKAEGGLGTRIDVRVCMKAIAPSETRAYIEHRLTAAGRSEALFDEAAIAAIDKWSGGRPRVINTLCDNALFEAYLRGSASVGAGDIERAAVDLGLSDEPAAQARDLGAAPVSADVVNPAQAEPMPHVADLPPAAPVDEMGDAGGLSLEEPALEELAFEPIGSSSADDVAMLEPLDEAPEFVAEAAAATPASDGMDAIDDLFVELVDE